MSHPTVGTDLQHPMTFHDLPDPGVNPVGHMTILQGKKRGAGLGKQGELFVTNVFSMVQAVLPVHHRAILSLSWMQYEKLKVGLLSYTQLAESAEFQVKKG